jgi:hypothetical protein
MPELLSVRRSRRKARLHRRTGRLAAPRRRKRRNLVKFIPEADRDFAFTAGNFLDYLKSDPAGHGLVPQNVAEIEQAVTGFRQSLAKLLMSRGRQPELVLRKRDDREHAEEVVRRWANVIRANPEVEGNKKKLLRLKPRPARLRRTRLSADPPIVHFLGCGDGTVGDSGIGNGSGVHVLSLRSCVTSNAKHPELGIQRRTRPDGATRAEVFAELVPHGAPIPQHPEERGRPWYLGSFSTTRIEVKFPIPFEPMVVVYWARWADEKGNVSRYSQTCVAGWAGSVSRAGLALPEQVGQARLAGAEAPRIETKVVYVQMTRSEPAELADQSGDALALPLPPRRQVEAVEVVGVKRLPEAVEDTRRSTTSGPGRGCSSIQSKYM